MTHKISLAPLTVLELSPTQAVETAAAAGYDYVGLRLIPSTPEETVYPIIGDTPLVRETRKRADDLGILILDIETLRLQPETDVRADYSRFVETGASLGARHILVAGNDPERHRLTDNFRTLAELAAEHNMIANLEFMPWTDVPDLRDAARVMQAVGHPSTGLLIDSIHFDRSGSNVEDLRTLPAEWFHYLQICDGPAEKPATTEQLIHHARHDRLLPGRGGIDLLGQLRYLPDNLVISVEVPLNTPEPLQASVRAELALAATREVLDRTASVSPSSSSMETK
ncbi:sugar phosphate isomerase/epimerase [Arthrobacter sp. ISL-85]|uniref:sugar phosphate isomerase/epimerase family protein n=1 Tax=Arthrobacter sp. ISL-85 TaxID=2819115 RepID=UPI001BEB9C93|nr:TIM barrel protein [Arthrobacter sp. ISL-85]MBT2565073.1 sugar phosphate isomerase/epimerase [Arthrobacter sp. ISL-85]